MKGGAVVRRRPRSITAALCAALVLGASGCSPGRGNERDSAGFAPARRANGEGGGAATAPATAHASAGSPSETPADAGGPLQGLRWSGEPLPVGTLLHDDGRRLWSIDARGRRTAVWRHPRAAVTSLAAAPDGTNVAMSVALEPRNGSDASYVLYELTSDGSVRVADRTHAFRSIDAPVFLRAPTGRRDAKPRLYWIRTGEAVDDLGRLDTQVMVLANRRREVRVPVRFAEAVFDIQGYPGADTFTLTLFRQNDVPTRAEVLRNDDARAPTTPSSLTLWGNNEPRAETDVLNGVAWLSPTDYVVPMAQRFHASAYALRLFRVGCEQLGSRVAYRGGDVDWGFSDLPWRLQPAGRHRVLVLGAADVRAAGARVEDGAGGVSSTFWRAVNVETGRMRRTRIAWEPGAWTWVEPDAVDAAVHAACGHEAWAWP
jgi:hypothetical protein